MKARLRTPVGLATAGALAGILLAATAAAASAQGVSLPVPPGPLPVPTGSLPGQPTPQPMPQGAAQHSVFVQTNNVAGNQVDVFTRHQDGRLSLRQVVSAGGLGGQTAGSGTDHLASQDSLVYDQSRGLLFAVNAGSNTVSMLSTEGLQVRLLEVVNSGGLFPVSVAVRGNLVYVLNAGGTGTVSGYEIIGDQLVALQGSTRSLGLANTTPPAFLTSPGEVGFSPNGSELVVTTKGSTNSLEVFDVSQNGYLSNAPTITDDGSNVPFAFVTTPSGQLVVAEAGSSALHSFSFGPDGTLNSLSTSVSDEQVALCWVATAGQYYYVANAGSGDVSAYTVAPDGTPQLLDGTGLPTATSPGPIDLAASPDGQYLYVESGGSGTINEFAVDSDGSLTNLGTVADLGVGIEGIATS